LLWFILCRHLSNEWSANEQYSYGWFVPFFALFLFWLRVESKWESRSQKVENEASGASSKLLLSTLAILLLAALLPLRLFEIGNPDWRPLGWFHAAIAVGLTLLLVWRVGGGASLRHFAFPICFIFVAVPWVTPIEAPVVQGLMRIVATIASEALNLCGIPAQLEGSVIRINSGVVGVNEACSGVRSLQTSLMIGLLFGELKRLSISKRAALVGVALAVAFLANCGRAFFLVWVAATQNLQAVGKWHDLAGYAIVGLVFVATIGIAALLGGTGAVPSTADLDATAGVPPVAAARFANRIPRFAIFAALGWLLAVEAGVEFWYRSHEQHLVTTPTWDVRWPESAPGFREIEIEENIRATLRFDRGREATWRASPLTNGSAPPALATFFMFFFRWEPGTTSILRARAHRPDICLPNSGWRMTEDRGVRLYPIGERISLPFRHFSFTRPASERREVTAHAFFCAREDRVATGKQHFDSTAGTTGNWSRSDRLRVVLEGLRNQGQQVMEVVMMTPPTLDAQAAEAEFARLIPELVQ